MPKCTEFVKFFLLQQFADNFFNSDLLERAQFLYPKLYPASDQINTLLHYCFIIFALIIKQQQFLHFFIQWFVDVIVFLL